MVEKQTENRFCTNNHKYLTQEKRRSTFVYISYVVVCFVGETKQKVDRNATAITIRVVNRLARASIE